jgi:hypothetical protein
MPEDNGDEDDGFETETETRSADQEEREERWIERDEEREGFPTERET